MINRAIFASSLIFLLFAATAGAKENPPTAAQLAEATTADRPEFSAPLVEEGLKLADFPNMEPRAELRDKLGHVSTFIQKEPRNGDPATEQSEVWIARSKTTLYFVFICQEKNPSQIRSHLVRRESLYQEDRVTVVLDPFQDHRKGVLFEINAAGQQSDAIWTEGDGPDFSYDQVWDSESVKTDTGWMGLIAIPFRSLRFPRNSSDWGVVFQRHLVHKNEHVNWPFVSAAVSGMLTQEGVMHGMEGMSGSHNIQFNPYAIAQNQHSLLKTDASHPYFTRRGLEGSGGGEIKAILKDSLVLDATVNPDFSTIESDQPQFQVNQRFKVFYPELRPFFLENANFFRTPINLVYTRNILHPEFGVRLSGKVDRTNVGLAVVDDRQPGEAVAPGNALYGKRALYTVARVSQDIHKNSSLGMIYTDEEFGGGWNRIGGVDFTALLDKNWTLNGITVVSSSHDDRNSTSAKPYSAGPASLFSLSREGHSLNMETYYKDFSSGFQSQLGFVPTTNLRNSFTHFTYQWYPRSKVVTTYGIETFQDLAWDHQGHRLWHYSNFVPFVILPRNSKILLSGGQNSDTLGPNDDSTLTGPKNFTENFIGLVTDSAPWAALNFHIRINRSGNVNYHPALGKPATLLKQQTLRMEVTIQPFNQLTMDNTYLLDRDFSAINKAFVYEAQTLRTKLNFQFTKALSARIIAEYDSTLANPAESSLLRSKQIGTQALISWLPHPGTGLYVGYNNSLQNIDRSLCFKQPGGGCDTNADDYPRSPDWLNDGRQLFVKFSYLYRF